MCCDMGSPVGSKWMPQSQTRSFVNMVAKFPGQTYLSKISREVF
jgi:hypothetical protein